MRVAPWLHFFEAENEGNNWGLNQSAESTNKIYVFYVVIPEVRLVSTSSTASLVWVIFRYCCRCLAHPKTKDFLLGINSAVQAVDYQALWGFFLWYPGHLWICSPSIPPFYIDWRWRCWRPRKIERELDRGSMANDRLPLDLEKRLTPGQLWYAIGEGCQESAEEAKDCAKESLGRWLVDFCRSFFLTVPIGLFNPLPCCSTLWVLHFSDVCCIRFPGSLSINACTHRGIGHWAASLGFWDILCCCIMIRMHFWVLVYTSTIRFWNIMKYLFLGYMFFV